MSRPARSPLLSRAPLLTLAALSAIGGCLFPNDLTVAPPPQPSAIPGAGPPPAPLASGRLPGNARPLRYEVSLAIDPTRERFTGDVTIALDIPAPTQAIVLHGRDLTVSRAEAMSGGEHVAAEASLRTATGREAPDELVLTLARPIPAGRAEVRVAWSAPISDKLSGLYRLKEEGAWYAFTQFEPTDARRMFPCFDEPGFKVPFDLKVTTPKGNLVVANTGELERTDAEDGRSITFRFAPTPPLPTYLFALAVGPLEIREAPPGPVKIRLVAPKGKTGLGDLALAAAAADVKLLAEYFGRPFPYPKLDLLAVPEFGFGAMENAGLVSIREDRVLLDPRGASAAARRAMATTLAHEIAHHWFGNLVSLKWWDDLWLNEGFATWIEARIVDAGSPGMDGRLDALRAKGVVMGQDALDAARAVRQPVATSAEAEEAFDGLTYDKGAAVFGMLEAWLGPEAFQKGIRAHLAAHEHGSAGAAELFAALDQASGKAVWPIASTFLDQPGVPLVRAELVCKPGEAPRVDLAQERYRPRAGSERRAEAGWKIPLCVAHEGSDKPACGLLAEATSSIALSSRGGRCPRWIYPNADERGYFRFALPPAQMAALVGASHKLPLPSRIGLIADVWALVQSGDMGSDTLLDLLEGMRSERHRLVVEELILALTRLGALVDDATRPAFRAFVTASLSPIARELGWDARKGEPDDRRLLRVQVLEALEGLAEDPRVTAEAEKRAAAWLADPRSVGADVAPIALRAAARRGGEKRFGELVDAAKKARSPEDRIAAVGALGAVDKAILPRALDLMLTDPIKIQDGFHIFNTAMARAEARPVVLAWLRERFAELRRKVPDFALNRLTIAVATICEAPVLEEAVAFFGPALRGTEGGERAMVQARETAELCIDLRGREAGRVKRRLGGGKRGK
jgi:aminopeptidase N